jgi:hypothetical protein
MILEYGQILATAHWVLDKELDWHLPKPAFINHPSNRWVRKSTNNYNFLFELFLGVLNEYTYRYKKIHCWQRYITLLKKAPKMDNTEFIEPPQCMPEEYKVKNNTVLAYQNYYNGAKYKLFHWKNREIPYFIKLENNING